MIRKQVSRPHFSASPRNEGPRANVLKKEDGYLIELAVPGFEKSDFEIRLEKEMLHISGKRSTAETNHYSRREFGLNTFERRFIVPENIIGSEIQAKYTNGILEVFLPEKKDPPRRVEVA